MVKIDRPRERRERAAWPSCPASEHADRECRGRRQYAQRPLDHVARVLARDSARPGSRRRPPADGRQRARAARKPDLRVAVADAAWRTAAARHGAAPPTSATPRPRRSVTRVRLPECATPRRRPTRRAPLKSKRRQLASQKGRPGAGGPAAGRRVRLCATPRQPGTTQPMLSRARAAGRESNAGVRDRRPAMPLAGSASTPSRNCVLRPRPELGFRDLRKSGTVRRR